MTCPYCKADWVPEANVDQVAVFEPAGFRCPTCADELRNGGLYGHGLLYCVACRGMLIPVAEFYPIVEEARARRAAPPYTGPPPSDLEGQRAIPCPFCGHPMDNHRYGGPGNVLIDTCEQCSVHWLDKGELMRIALAPDHQYAPDREVTSEPPRFW
jgi:Zn-finger nucleic acid-binding protein